MTSQKCLIFRDDELCEACPRPPPPSVKIPIFVCALNKFHGLRHMGHTLCLVQKKIKVLHTSTCFN